MWTALYSPSSIFVSFQYTLTLASLTLNCLAIVLVVLFTYYWKHEHWTCLFCNRNRYYVWWLWDTAVLQLVGDTVHRPPLLFSPVLFNSVSACIPYDSTQLRTPLRIAHLDRCSSLASLGSNTSQGHTPQHHRSIIDSNITSALPRQQTWLPCVPRY